MSGRLSLAVTGIQDLWLTGSPQFSYFLMNFKRHTKFSIEHIETPFDGDLRFGNEFLCRIPHNKGDLIKNMTLKITLQDPGPDIEVGELSGNYLAYVPSICTELLEHIELRIGGQTIQRLTGEYVFMHQQLNNSDDDVFQTLYFLNGHGGFLSYQGTYTYFLDIPFYFYRHPSLAIPMCALTKQLVEVNIKLRNANEVVFGYPFTPAPPETVIKNISLDTEFVFLTDDEKGFLLTRPVEQVITQLQMSQVNIEAGLTRKAMMLNFKHPVKEMFFIAQSDAYKNANYSLIYEDITRLQLKFNNQVVFDIDKMFMTYGHVYNNYVNIPYTTASIDYLGNNTTLYSVFGVYSFSNSPDKYYPTGQVNMSRIVHKLLDVEIAPYIPEYDVKFRIYATNYNVLRIESGIAGLKF